MVPVLFLTGPIGVGKTSVLNEADALLVAAGARHATVELEDIARCWTDVTQSSAERLVYENLAALWANYVSVGASRLLLGGLLEQRADLRRVVEAVPRAAVTVVRLDAPLPVLERRIRRRHPGRPGDELCGARWWADHFDAVSLEDHRVATEGRSVTQIAQELLRVARWLP